MDKATLQALREKSVQDITNELASLQRADLSELLALEDEADPPRVTLTKAIAAEIEKRDEPEVAPDAADAAASTSAAHKGDPKTDHTHPHYTGPLTIEQADWRHRNLKPAKVAVKK